MSDCIFCKIASGEINADFVKQTEDYVAFKDLSPQAPVHILVIPRKHIASLSDFEDSDLLAKTMQGVREVAAEAGLLENGYRVVNNIGEHGGQSVNHVHFHVLGGRHLGWPPG